MYRLSRTGQFDRDVKACLKRRWEGEALREAIAELANSDVTPIDARMRPHALSGEWKGYRAVHVPSKKLPPKDKWVLVYRVRGSELQLVRTGSHQIYQMK